MAISAMTEPLRSETRISIRGRPCFDIVPDRQEAYSVSLTQSAHIDLCILLGKKVTEALRRRPVGFGLYGNKYSKVSGLWRSFSFPWMS